jgi:hypothetical protein
LCEHRDRGEKKQGDEETATHTHLLEQLVEEHLLGD